MSTAAALDRHRRLAALVALVDVGTALVLAIVIRHQPRDPGPPEDVPRALVFLAAYATPGLLALIGAFQRRPAIVAAAGLLSLVGSVVSVATVAFAVPGVVLAILGVGMWRGQPERRHELVIAAVVVLLVAAGSVAPLAMAQDRCWQASKSSADPPVYSNVTLIPCTDTGAAGEAPQALATGSQGGVLTTGGLVVELALLLGALTLTAVTGRAAPHSGGLARITPPPV